MIWPMVTAGIIRSGMQSVQTAYSGIERLEESQHGEWTEQSYLENPLMKDSHHTSGFVATALPVTSNPQSYIDATAEMGTSLLVQLDFSPAISGELAGGLLFLSLIGIGTQADLGAFESSEKSEADGAGDKRQDSTPNANRGGSSAPANESNSTDEEIEPADADDSTNFSDDADPSSWDGDAEGAIYVRVSSQQQADEGNSLEDQVSRLLKLADERGISLICDSIKDGAETGTDFDRPGIKQVTELARNGEISYLLVDDIDRIGRNAPECLHYIYQLRQCGVTVITTQDGELDVDEITGLAVTFVKTFSSQLENETRSRRVKEARIEQFRQKNWLAAFKVVPFGYSEREDRWIQVDQEEADAFRRAVKFFLETRVEGAYQRTVDAVGLEKHGISTRRLKVLLQRPVYVGEPTYRRGSDAVKEGLEDTVTVEDEDLEILSQERFECLQHKVEAVHERYSTGRSGTADVDNFVERFGIEVVQNVCDLIELRCPSTDCSGELVKNGSRTTDDEDVHNYICNCCDRQRKFPLTPELDAMRESDEDD